MNARIRPNPRSPGSTRQQAQQSLEPYPLTATHTDDQHRPAANEARARGRFEHFRDPLWFITFGMATFFALVLFLMTLG